MAKDKTAAEPAKPAYVALVGLEYWSGGKLRKVAAGTVVDDIPANAVDNWRAITPPAIREATEDEAKGVTA